MKSIYRLIMLLFVCIMFIGCGGSNGSSSSPTSPSVLIVEDAVLVASAILLEQVSEISDTVVVEMIPVVTYSEPQEQPVELQYELSGLSCGSSGTNSVLVNEVVLLAIGGGYLPSTEITYTSGCELQQGDTIEILLRVYLDGMFQGEITSSLILVTNI